MFLKHIISWKKYIDKEIDRADIILHQNDPSTVNIQPLNVFFIKIHWTKNFVNICSKLKQWHEVTRHPPIKSFLDLKGLREQTFNPLIFLEPVPEEIRDKDNYLI